MAVGGISVIIAIVLIAFYLLYVVIPMFKPASIEQIQDYPVPGSSNSSSLYYAMEEQREIGLRVSSDASAVFFDTASGDIRQEYRLLGEQQANLSSFAAGDPSQRLIALGLDNGQVLLAQHNYQVSYPDDVRLITPGIDFPLGNEPVPVSTENAAIVRLSAQWDGEQASIAALDQDNNLLLVSFAMEENFLSDEVDIERSDTVIPFEYEASHILLDVEQRELYVSDTMGFISYFDISDKTSPRLIQRVRAVSEDQQISAITFLLVF